MLHNFLKFLFLIFCFCFCFMDIPPGWFCYIRMLKALEELKLDVWSALVFTWNTFLQVAWAKWRVNELIACTVYTKQIHLSKSWHLLMSWNLLSTYIFYTFCTFSFTYFLFNVSEDFLPFWFIFDVFYCRLLFNSHISTQGSLNSFNKNAQQIKHHAHSSFICGVYNHTCIMATWTAD